MTPQQLKNSILQMAMQGKLVEQRPEEGTGEELYQQIQKEKRKLIKEGKIKKEKPLPEITEDEVPFEIPESWKWVHINEIASTSLGKTLNKLTDKGDIVPYLCSINIRDGQIDLTQLKSAPFSIEEQDKYRLALGDLLICEGGDVGKAAVWNSGLQMYYQNALHRVRFFIEGLSDFYRLMLEYYKGIGLITQASKGVTIKHFVQASLYSLCCPLPPLAEQKRIVAKIEEIMPFIDRYAAAYDNLQSYNTRFPDDLKKSILQMAIQGKLVPQDPNDEPASVLLEKITKEKQKLIKEGKIKKQKPLPPIKDEEIPFDIPESWKWVHWGEVINVVSARRVHQADWKSSGIPFYRAREIAKLAENGVVDNELFISQNLFDEFSKSGVPHPGDLMVTAVGTLGKTYIVQPDDHFYYKDASVLCFENYAKINAKYLKMVMHSELMGYQIKSNSGGTTVSTLTIIRMNDYLLPLPPLAEQKRIVAKLDELLPQIDSLK